ncbi:hypothetical protein EfmJHP36_17840 [Enterococcus faecium]|nr:hypothetical protein EfmJHP36_17840 [Enterococcus faecium]
MLKISYKPSTDSKEMKKEYETVNDFLQGQYLEVPPLQDHFVVTTVTLDGKEIEMPDQTISGLITLTNKYLFRKVKKHIKKHIKLKNYQRILVQLKEFATGFFQLICYFFLKNIKDC